MSSTLDRVATAPTALPKVTSSAGRTNARRFLPALVVAVVAVLIWWVAAVLVDSLIFPTPAEAMASLVEDLGKADFRANVYDSLLILVLAFLASTVVGSILGLTLGLSPFWTRTIAPIVYSINSMVQSDLRPGLAHSLLRLASEDEEVRFGSAASALSAISAL